MPVDLYNAEKLGWLFVVTLVIYGLGFFSPMMTVSKHVEKFWIVLVDEKNTISLFSGLCDLFSEGHYFMFFIISVFSVLFPLSKIGLCGALISSSLDREIKHKITSLLYHAGKWSMLDVFVVGILVTTIKLGSVAEVSMHSGVFWFALSVLLSFWLKAEAMKHSNMHNPRSTSNGKNHS